MDHTKMPATAQVEIRKITPEDAEKLLEANEVNRTIRPSLVAAYRRDMDEGRWHFTAEPIQISKTGRLINGQHRLSALATSKKVAALSFVVATGLEDEAQTMMDQGAPRTIRDALIIRFGNIKNATLVSSVTRWIALAPELGPTFTPTTLRVKISTAEAVEVYMKEADLIDEAVFFAKSIYPVFPASPTAVAYCYYQFSKIDPEATKEFFQGMLDMEWAWAKDPRKAALRRMQMMVREHDWRNTTDTSVGTVSLLSRAWNAWRKNEKVESFMFYGRKGLVDAVRPV